MDMSIKLLTLLPFVIMAATAAPTAPGPQEDMLRTLINPPIANNPATATATTNNNQDNMIAGITLPADKSAKSIEALKEALTVSVKSQLMTSLANMSPEQVSTITGAANPGQLSQLNLMGGINNLVGLIVQKILQALLPRIFGGQNSTPATTNTNMGGGFPFPGRYNPQPQQPMGLGGLFGGSMNPMSMMIPGMMFGVMDKMFEFL